MRWIFHKLGIIEMVYLVRSEGDIYSRRMRRYPDILVLEARLGGHDNPLKELAGWVSCPRHGSGCRLGLQLDGGIRSTDNWAFWKRW